MHIEPDEERTLAHIPDELLFPAPRLPEGHVLMGYDEQGHCPMLVDGSCSIYEYRPRTCRVYDCRIFAASGTPVLDPAQEQIAEQVRRWEFRFLSSEDEAEYRSVRRAAAYLVEHADELEGEFGSMTPLQQSLYSIELSSGFPGRGPGAGQAEDTESPLSAVRVALRTRRGGGKVRPPGW